MNLVDTSGWIEFFFDGENASDFVDPIRPHRTPDSCLEM